MDNLSIDFYDESQGAVSLTWPVGVKPEVKLALDTILFACYTLRQLRSLGSHASARGLADMLCSWSPQNILEAPTSGNTGNIVTVSPYHVMHNAALIVGLTAEEASEKYGKPILLVPYRGVAKKRFVAQLQTGGPKMSFLLFSKGFGLGGLLVGKDLPFYATDSVLLFLAFLTRLYAPYPKYLDGLKAIANECAEAYVLGNISGPNQEELAVTYVKRHLLNNA